jgi:hypothetical protein
MEVKELGMEEKLRNKGSEGSLGTRDGREAEELRLEGKLRNLGWKDIKRKRSRGPRNGREAKELVEGKLKD